MRESLCASAQVVKVISLRALTGVFEMQKVAAEGWSVGSLIYWSRSENLVTAKGAGNALIGVATATSTNPSGVGTVRLNGAFMATGLAADHVIYDDSASITNTTSKK